MSLSCEAVRSRLAQGRDAAVDAHLATCAACAEVAQRWRAVHGVLSAPPAAVTPRPGFARRVTAELSLAPDAIGWAALRLLPIAAALALVLTGWLWVGDDTAVSSTESLSNDIASWIVSSEDVSP